MKLENRVAIVTGGSNGIGRAISIGLAKEGADVVVNFNADTVAANEAVNEIKGLGRKAIAIKTDVSKSDQVNRMIKTVFDEFGKIDILVNNAGGSARERGSLFCESTEEIWDYVIGLNLKGVLNCSRAVINHMIERRSGKIVNISSTAGITGDVGLVDYAAAKAGIGGFTMALAKEVAMYGINVNCVTPGAILTRAVPLTQSDIKTEDEQRTMGFGRLGTPEDVAPLVVFMVTDGASLITGQNYAVCGLMNLGPIAEGQRSLLGKTE